MNTWKIVHQMLKLLPKGRAIYIFSLVFLCFAVGVQAQDDLIIYGTAKDSDTFKKLSGVEVTVLKGGSEFDHIPIGSSGKFEVNLPLGGDYTIIFEKDGFVSKRVFIQTSQVPVEDREGGFEMDVDMTLFAYIEGFDTKILEQPIGKAAFDNIKNSLVWDFGYTEDIQEQITAEFKRLENAAGDEARKRAEFDKAIKEGDAAMVKKDYDEAVGKYSFALAIFPDDVPAQQKLADAQAKLDAENAAANLEKQYQQLIADGNKNMSSEKWQAAKEKYTAALDLKPTEKLPKDKLAEIDKILAGLSNKAAYDAIIADADKKFDSGNYGVSIEKYEEAVKMMPLEDYPRDQIKKAQAFIDDMLDEERRKAELERKYNEFITLADRNFDNKSYEDAIRPYEQAAELKPEEKHPKDRLIEIQKILDELAKKNAQDKQNADANAEQARIDREYQAFIDAGNDLFSGDDLEGAKEKFIAASGVKPAERYPKNKVEEIDKLIKQRELDRIAAQKANEQNAEQSKIDAAYQKLIDEANELFDDSRLNDAKSAYSAALEIKSAEKYPKSRILRIDEMLAELARQDKLDEQNAANKLENQRLADEKARLAEEQRKEEERLAELERKKDEQARLAEEARQRKLDEENRNQVSLNNVDSSREDDVERYYREARESELKAKYNNIKKEKEQLDEWSASKAEENRDKRIENRQIVDEKQDALAAIYRDGRDVQDKNKRFKAKEKEQWESKDVEWTESFGYKRLQNQEKAEEKKDQQRAIKEKDELRQEEISNVESKKLQFSEQQQSFEKMGRALAADSEYEVERDKMSAREVAAAGDERQKDNAEIAEVSKQKDLSFKQDASDAGKERTFYKADKIDTVKAEANSIGAGKEAKSEQNEAAIELKKESMEVFNQNKAREAKIKSESARMDLFDKDSGSEKTADNYILPSGAEDLQEGVNETSYELPGKTVIERTVKMGNKVDVYRKVVSKTGTYYFKENRSITESTWRRETMNLND